MSHGAVATAASGGGGSLVDRVYSFAVQSVTDTKDTLILVCIALLEALDRLQQRLHLPTTLVKELKRRLAKMIDVSLSPSSTRKASPALGDALADSDMWAAAKPEEVRGVVQWAIDVVKYLNHLVVASSLCVCRGIFILIMRVPGVSTACALFYRVLQLVEDTVQLSSETIRDMAGAAGGAGMGSHVGEVSGSRGSHHSHHRHRADGYIGDSSMTAVVLEYREKECMVPSNIDQRIRRVMHFQIPLRSFEATVRLPPSHVQGSSAHFPLQDGSTNVLAEPGSYVPISSASPRSIPASPRARRRVQLAFSNFSDDVLYQARDRLRLERAATITGTRNLLVPVFNPQDCNDEIYLSCGRHCATKVGPGMYRSVRGSVALPRNRLAYFEMTLQEVRSPARTSSQTSRLLERSSSSDASASASGTGNARVGGGADASVCIGVSTRSMALNSLVGTTRYSVGFYSAGHVLVGANRRSFVAVNRGYGFQSTVGVLTRIVDEQEEGVGRHGGGSDQDRREAQRGSQAPRLSIAIPQSAATATALVRFTVDGVVLRDSNGQVMEFTLPFPAHNDLFPTLTLHSQGVQVFGRFSAPDIAAASASEMDLAREEAADLWCLDGLQLAVPP